MTKFKHFFMVDTIDDRFLNDTSPNDQKKYAEFIYSNVTDRVYHGVDGELRYIEREPIDKDGSDLLRKLKKSELLKCGNGLFLKTINFDLLKGVYGKKIVVFLLEAIAGPDGRIAQHLFGFQKIEDMYILENFCEEINRWWGSIPHY